MKKEVIFSFAYYLFFSELFVSFARLSPIRMFFFSPFFAITSEENKSS